jgi:signal transduction protein with GAF and PtsI domain
MQASKLHPFQSSLNPSYPEASGNGNYSAIAPLLDLGLTESNAQGAYLYAVDLANSAARLVLWSGLSPIAATLPLELEGSSVRVVFSRTSPLVLQEQAWEHASFEGLAEFRKNRFEGVASIPLLESGQVMGLLNICRSERVGLKPRAFSFLLSLGVPIGALLAASAARVSLEREVEKLNRQLADRKLLERAKGLIQSRFEWTEEQAYLCIRNLSRRRRTPMRRIAEEVITAAASVIAEEAAR